MNHHLHILVALVTMGQWWMRQNFTWVSPHLLTLVLPYWTLAVEVHLHILVELLTNHQWSLSYNLQEMSPYLPTLQLVVVVLFHSQLESHHLQQWVRLNRHQGWEIVNCFYILPFVFSVGLHSPCSALCQPYYYTWRYLYTRIIFYMIFLCIYVRTQGHQYLSNGETVKARKVLGCASMFNLFGVAFGMPISLVFYLVILPLLICVF